MRRVTFASLTVDGASPFDLDVLWRVHQAHTQHGVLNIEA